jgi:2-hydroxy-3-oxopropionate reductase
MKLGFIGLGIMGKPMARNLLKAGHEVVVFNRSQGAVDELVAEGAGRGSSYAQIGADCPVIFTMLPNSPDVERVVCGEDGVLSAAKAGTIIVDMSSIAPLASQAIARACAEKGVRMLEAPVSGGEPKAIDGTLSFMCGGEEALFNECLPLLKCMGADVVYCGESGAGNTTKLANQVIVAVNIAAVSEAFMLAKRAGVDPSRVLDAIRGGLAGSAVMNAKGPMMIANNTKPGFKIDLHIKDLNNALDTGHGVGSPLPLTAAVMEMFQTLHADGMGQCDHSALAKYYEKLAGDTIY